MKVREIMTADVATAAPDTSLREIANMMREEDTGAIPVLDGDELAGILTDRDIVIRCVAEGRDPEDTTAEEILSERLETVEPDTDVGEASTLMARRQVRRLPVVEDGRLVGMVSLGDIAVRAEEDVAADALENVSEGVNASRATKRARPQAAVARREQAGTAPRGGTGGTSEIARRGTAQTGKFRTGGQRQEISNRSAREEEQRQARVIPFREGKGGEAKGKRAKGKKVS